MSYRSKGGQRYAFYLNHSAAPVTVALAKPGLGAADAGAVAGSVEVPVFGVFIVKEA